jgi:tRNA (guanine9-N1)-methyltransferase
MDTMVEDKVNGKYIDHNAPEDVRSILTACMIIKVSEVSTQFPIDKQWRLRSINILKAYTPMQNTLQSDPDAGPSPPTAGQTPKLSKNQQRKLRRLQKLEERKQERKRREKEARQAAKEQRREANVHRFSQMTEEEIVAWKAERDAKSTARKQEKEAKLARLNAAMESGQKIVVDCDFAELMTEKECKSLAQQLGYCYSANSRAAVPAHLVFAGVRGAVAAALMRQVPGLENWLVTKTDATYMDHFEGEASSLVYLTADSPDELQELDPSKVYVVGGLVDRNRHKGVCYEKAREQGIATAKLPIGHFMQLSSSQVKSCCSCRIFKIIIFGCAQ